MGIPKFYRWLSERYPKINQVIQNDAIKPEFDNLYLDMNGIVHNCTHGDSPAVDLKVAAALPKPLTESEIFAKIFKYIDKLFHMVKPRKLLFMAIDGVAPRAKMNQQRQRRFRSAMEAKEALEEAKSRGERPDEENRWDSNCITPGTEFMFKLSEHVKYFVRQKMKEDAAWQQIKVIFSGAEVPGEGEHKIMLFIRNMKMQRGYEPNIRHCLYGLDADLIMLSVVSHEPHFALLREEVVFGSNRTQNLPRKAMTKQGEFQFLHLSLLREYIDLEFRAAFKNINFYDLERVLDDWVFMCFLVGNDFIPHLPTLDIAEGGLDTLLTIYKATVPVVGGYLTNEGKLDVTRLEVIFKELAKFEGTVFQTRLNEEAREKSKHNRSNRSRKNQEFTDSGDDEPDSAAADAAELEAAEEQKWLDSEIVRAQFGDIKQAVAAADAKSSAAVASAAAAAPAPAASSTTATAAAQPQKDADGKDIPFEFLESNSYHPLSKAAETRFNQDQEAAKHAAQLAAQLAAQKAALDDGTGALQKDFRFLYYASKFPEFFDASKEKTPARVFPNGSPNPSPSPPPAAAGTSGGASPPSPVDEKRDVWTRGSKDARACVRELCLKYLESLVWVLQYYYAGCTSWKWFFPYRYAPLASDMTSLAEFKIEFELGQPFRPMEQLMAVLPPASSKLVPVAFRDLMSSIHSPILDYYPPTFKVDMNSKKNSWEGIALIPFIEEKRLLGAMHAINTSKLLSPAEQARNERVGHETIVFYDPSCRDSYAAPSAGFTTIYEMASRAVEWRLPAIPGGDVKGVDSKSAALTSYDSSNSGRFLPRLCAGVSIPFPGYPCIGALPVEPALAPVSVNVFGRESKKDSLTLKVLNDPLAAVGGNVEQYALSIMNQRVWVEWPYLKEGMVSTVSDGVTRWTADGTSSPVPSNEQSDFDKEAQFFRSKQLTSGAVEANEVKVLVGVRVFARMARTQSGATVKQYSEEEKYYPAQLIVVTNKAPDPRLKEKGAPTLEQAFPLNEKVIFIGPNYYGNVGVVVAHNQPPPKPAKPDSKSQAGAKLRALGSTVDINVTVQPMAQPFGRAIAARAALKYFPSFLITKQLGLHPLVLAKLTSSIFINPGKVDIGLRLKFQRQGMVVADYCRRVESANRRSHHAPEGEDTKKPEQWEYSEFTVQILALYQKRFPRLFGVLNANPTERLYDIQDCVEPAVLKKSGAEAFDQKAAEAAVKEIVSWVGSLGISSQLLVPCTSQVLPDRGIPVIEAEATKYHKSILASTPQTVRVKDVPLYQVYKPNPAIAWSPSESTAPELGDRVLSLRSDEGVPFALQGTIVAIHGSFVEVVFDADFMSGNSLNKRCSDQRGKVVALSSLLNLSKPRTIEPKSNAIVEAPVVAAAAPLKKVWNTWAAEEQKDSFGRGGGGGGRGGGRGGGGGGGGGGFTIGACFNCGQTGHKSFECPNPKGGAAPKPAGSQHQQSYQQQMQHSASASASGAPNGSGGRGRGAGRGRGFGADQSGSSNFQPYKQSGAGGAAGRGSTPATTSAPKVATVNLTATAPAPTPAAAPATVSTPAAAATATATATAASVMASLAQIAPHAVLNSAPAQTQAAPAPVALSGDPLAFWNQLQQKASPAPASATSGSNPTDPAAVAAALKGMLNVSAGGSNAAGGGVAPLSRIQYKPQPQPLQPQPHQQMFAPQPLPMQMLQMPVQIPIPVPQPLPATAASKAASAMRAQLRGAKGDQDPASPTGEAATAPATATAAAASAGSDAGTASALVTASATGSASVGPPPLVPLVPLPVGMMGMPAGMPMMGVPHPGAYLNAAYGGGGVDPQLIQQQQILQQQRMAAQFAQFQNQQQQQQQQHTPHRGGRGRGRGRGRGGHNNSDN